MTVANKSLISKLALIYGEVGNLTKTGTNEVQRYKYAEAAEVANLVRPLFSKHGLTLTPTDITVVDAHEESRDGKASMKYLTLVYHWTISDSTSGETLPIVSVGSGFDSGDKAAYKAATGAFKYAIMTSLMLSAGDDAENEKAEPAPRLDKNAPGAKASGPQDAPADRIITDAMRKKLFASAHGVGLTDAQVKALMGLLVQKDSTHALTFSDFDRLLLAFSDPEKIALVEGMKVAA
jgi:hypothetical protein